MVKNGDFVVPGELLGISEEFIPGEGAYEEDGRIFSSVTGVIELDTKERKIKITPKTSAPLVPKGGDIVLGKVWDVKAQIAMVDILKIKGKERTLPGSTRGGIHISQTRPTYVSDISREFKVGDIIYARIVNTNRSPIQLSTADKELGVIKAFCSSCNLPLALKKKDLMCSDCERKESRKMSSMYGMGET